VRDRTDRTGPTTPLPRREPGTHYPLTTDPRATTLPPKPAPTSGGQR
jgi:hypothetical protein